VSASREPLTLLRDEELADAAEGLIEIFDAVNLGVLDICPPLIALLAELDERIAARLCGRA
jgi:hypothetical protein